MDPQHVTPAAHLLPSGDVLEGLCPDALNLHLHAGDQSPGALGSCAPTRPRAAGPEVPLPPSSVPRCLLCAQEPAFGMLTVPLRTPLTRLPAEYHVEAVGIFKLVRVCTDHLPNHSPSPEARQETPMLLPWTLHQPRP